MSSTRGFVFDHTAVLALANNRAVSWPVSEATRRPDRFVFVPALCLAAATAQRPQVADHVGLLPSIDVIDLGYVSAVAVGRLIAQGVDWRLAHAVVVGRPDPEWPGGRVVMTAMPKAYSGLGVATIAI